MSDQHDGREHKYCEQCGDCIICDNPHRCINQLLRNAIVRELPEGAEPQPGSIVIETTMSKQEVQQAINDLGKPKEQAMKTSWRKILAFNNFVNGFVSTSGQQFSGWLALHPEETKFNYAIKRVTDQIQKLNTAIQVKFENIDIDNCATGENGVIIRDPDTTLSFTKEGLKARNKARAELLDAEDVEIEPYYATEIPESLSEADREFFVGFVIKEEEKLSAVA